MTHLLPPNLLKLFAPRPPLPFFRSVGKDPEKVKSKNVAGVAALLAQIREDNERGIVGAGVSDDREEGEEERYTYAEEIKRSMYREQKQKRVREEFQRAKETYKPADDPEAIGDPYKTLFISRLSKNATEEDLRKEFGVYGRIDRIRLVKNKRGHSRGYAFIVYDREKDMKAAYKEADGVTILGKRILVDVERGRTVRGWKPRRLGGGLGGKPIYYHPYRLNYNRHVAGRPKPVAPAAEAPRFGPPSGGGFRGGDRGGRGGFRGGFSDRPGGGFRGRGGGFGGGRGGGGGFGGGDRGYGDRGGGGDRGGFGGGDRGYGGMNGEGGRGGFGGGDRGGYGPRGGGGGGGGYGGDSGYGGRNDSGGGGYGPSRGRGGGIGYQGGFGGHQDNGYQNSGGGGYGGGQDNGYPPKRGYDDGADRDSKRTRY
ncbi:hypothetical protein FRC07_000328 [Ceratobasidium sp. 392]|nr:hypothetical protein FRC07_000328 [Ceratobasidium sp. 392]